MAITSEFRKWQKEHPNFMTPRIERLVVRGNKVIELSSGEDFEHKRMYGVTKLERIKANKFKTLGGKPFRNKKDALKYFNKLKKVM